MTVQPSPLAASTAATCAGQRRHRRRDERQLGVRHRLLERSGRHVDRAALPRDRERRRVRVEPATDATPARFAASPTDAPIRPVPTMASRDRTSRLGAYADDFAHEGRKRPDLVGEAARSRRTEICCAASRERLLGIGCTSTMIPSAPAATAARASGATRSRRPAACDGIDDHRQVRLLLQHRDRADVERVARRASRTCGCRARRA